METDDEVVGTGNSYTTDYRQYDPRLGRWLSIDPLFRNFPWQSPYAAFDNNPILIKDPRGLAGENSNGNPDKKMERQNKRFERLQNRLANKFGQGTDKYYSELARIGSKARYGSALEFNQGYQGVETGNGKSGKTNNNFSTTFDNTKAIHQEAVILGAQQVSGTPQIPSVGDVAGETSVDVMVSDGQQLYFKASTLSGYQVQVFVNGQLLIQFSESPQPAFDPKTAYSGTTTHTRLTEYKSATVSTGSPTPQLMTVTFRTVFSEVGTQVHYTGYPIPTRTAIVSIGTLR
jgi:RHS repeat-associated protein